MADLRPTTEVVMPQTGEVVTSSLLATVYANGLEELADVEAEARRIRGELAEMAEALRPAAAEGPVDAGKGRALVLDPPPRGSQRVSRDGAARYREVLLDMGLGREVMEFRPPTITDVRRHSAELIARGVDLGVLAPEPMPGPGTLRVVTLEARP